MSIRAASKARMVILRSEFAGMLVWHWLVFSSDVGSAPKLGEGSYQCANVQQEIDNKGWAMSIVPIGGPIGPQSTRSVRGVGGREFHLPSEASVATQRAARTSSVVDLSAMLSLQDVDPPQERDRRARRQGEGLLQALARLQRALLGEEGQQSVLAELAELSASPEIAANPALREVTEAIRIRAAVELARATMAM